MKLLVLGIKVDGFSEAPLAVRTEVLEMPDNYDTDSDGAYGKFDQLRAAFSEKVLSTRGTYDTERARWGDPRTITIGSISKLDGCSCKKSSGKVGSMLDSMSANASQFI